MLMDTITVPDAHVRRSFAALSTHGDGPHLSIGKGRTVHARGTTTLWGVTISVARCGSSPAAGPYTMAATTSPITCTRTACATVMSPMYQPPLF